MTTAIDPPDVYECVGCRLPFDDCTRIEHERDDLLPYFGPEDDS